MAHRYLEIIIPTRQFALLIVVVVGLIAGAFTLGVAVRLSEPTAVPAQVAATTGGWAREPVTVPTQGLPAAPTAVTDSGSALPEPTAAPPVVGGSPLTLPPPAESEGAARPVRPVATQALAGPSPWPAGQEAHPTPRVEPTPTPKVAPAPTPVAAQARTVPASVAGAAVTPAAAAPAAAPTHAASKGHPWIQVAAVSRQDVADDVGQSLVKLGFKSSQVTIHQDAKGLYHVRLGPFLDAESANRVVARLRESGYKDPFLVKE